MATNEFIAACDAACSLLFVLVRHVKGTIDLRQEFGHNSSQYDGNSNRRAHLREDISQSRRNDTGQNRRDESIHNIQDHGRDNRPHEEGKEHLDGNSTGHILAQHLERQG